MIVVIGMPAEEPVQQLLDAASRLGIATVLLPESDAASWNLRVDCAAGQVRACVEQPGATVELDAATGIYLRLTSPRQHQPPDPLRQQRQDAALALICSWAEATPVRVANRPSAMASNNSKPYQAALIRREGLGVPETIVTNDPDQVREFQRRLGRVVYKSTSGARSIVHELTPTRATTLERVRNLPTQFQQLLTGSNMRVHVIGRQIFACEILAETVDYRYREGGSPARIRPVELPPEVEARCLALSAALGLPLAGIDLLRDADDRWWCFEVNPSPAYSCFSEPTGLPMAEALARWLGGCEAT
jgi:glutathione synthase/RimK-type ligase-like ATP-grasp enzyme